MNNKKQRRFMKIDITQTANNIAENCYDHGRIVDELSWLLTEGFKGFKNMTTEEIEKFTIETYGLSKDSFPDIIVYSKENQ